MSKLGDYLDRARLKLADWIIGERSVLFMTEREYALMKRQDFLSVDTETLGLMFRRWWAQVCASNAERGERDGQTFDAVMTSGSVLWLASKANKANADSAQFAVSGTIDGGKTTSKWAVSVQRLPDDYEFAGCNSVTHDEHDPSKITEMVVHIENPGYAKWLEQRRASTPTHAGKGLSA